MKIGRWIVGLVRFLAVVLALLGLYIFATVDDVTKNPLVASKEVTVKKKAATVKQSKVTLPSVSVDDWELVLVNRDHPVGDSVPELADVSGILVDSRIREATEAFVSEVMRLDANEPLQGLYLGYQSVDEQEVLFQTRLAEEMAAGLTEEEAMTVVGQALVPAGYSEHHTGLAIDLMSGSLVAEAIAKAAPEYGFILRYPVGKEDITGFSHEDWHFRYVGVESAKYMTENNLTLEEYLEQLRSQ